MSGYAIIVDFGLKPGVMAEFRQLIDANAEDSCRLEPGCRRFDVLVPQGSANRIVLYEIYDSRLAFDDHLKKAHFLNFDQASAALIVTKTVSVFALACEGSAPQNQSGSSS